MTVEERESVEELRARRAQVQRDIDFNFLRPEPHRPRYTA